MTWEEAIKFLSQYIDNDCYTEKCQEAHRMAITALRPVSREQLSEFKTCDLVDELRKREGVETHIAEPYQDVTVSVNGPAVVLVVID
jgi:hypothetical protein